MNEPHQKDGQSLPIAGNNLSRICGVRPEFIQSTTALPLPEHIGGSEGGEVAAVLELVRTYGAQCRVYGTGPEVTEAYRKVAERLLKGG